MADSLEREAFYRSLPTKRMAAGCVLRNLEGQLLAVKPTYKDGWELPGGVVEDSESPREACRRELAEELGIDLDPGLLLCVDYCGAQPGYVESLQFLFDGGVLDKDTIATIRLNDSELSELVWIAIDESERLFRGGRVARRLRASASFLGTGRVVYLEDQQPVSGSIDLTE